jgi:hypothetical protein
MVVPYSGFITGARGGGEGGAIGALAEMAIGLKVKAILASVPLRRTFMISPSLRRPD